MEDRPYGRKDEKEVGEKEEEERREASRKNGKGNHVEEECEGEEIRKERNENIDRREK